MTVAWVVGGSGMLGSAIRRAAASAVAVDWELSDAPPLPWARDSEFDTAAEAGLRRLRDESRGGAWAIVWAAGAAVTSATAAQIAGELDQLRRFCEQVTTVFTPAELARGSLFYASSAGGIYGGASRPPFDETTRAAPISRYGEFKLAGEATVQSVARAGARVFCGRITNLYGPGQKLSKMQGIISHLARAQLTPRPASIFVPLETVRDYLYVDDASRLVLDCLQRLSTAPPGTSVVKILGSGRGTSIADLLGEFHRLTKKRANVMLGYSAAASLQGLDLRMRSSVWPDLDRKELTPLAAGIHATYEDILRQIQNPSAAR
jgi:UDP-glucose 4-epimerase